MGYIYLYTGTGGGKTANALGLALRSVGHGRKVVIIQFLKWNKEIGEYKIREKLSPNYEIYQFGRSAWLGEQDTTVFFGGQSFRVERFKEVDRSMAKKGLKFAKNILRDMIPDLLVLDEINLALHWKLVDVNDVLDLLSDLPSNTDVVLTGRYAPSELIDKADFVNIINQIKAPKESSATKGIQF